MHSGVSKRMKYATTPSCLMLSVLFELDVYEFARYILWGPDVRGKPLSQLPCLLAPGRSEYIHIIREVQTIKTIDSSTDSFSSCLMQRMSSKTSGNYGNAKARS